MSGRKIIRTLFEEINEVSQFSKIFERGWLSPRGDFIPLDQKWIGPVTHKERGRASEHYYRAQQIFLEFYPEEMKEAPRDVRMIPEILLMQKGWIRVVRDGFQVHDFNRSLRVLQNYIIEKDIPYSTNIVIEVGDKGNDNYVFTVKSFLETDRKPLNRGIPGF